MKTSKSLRFSHDYPDCIGKDCDCKSDCIQHLAYLEAKEFSIPTTHIEKCEDKNANYVRVRIEK